MKNPPAEKYGKRRRVILTVTGNLRGGGERGMSFRWRGTFFRRLEEFHTKVAGVWGGGDSG